MDDYQRVLLNGSNDAITPGSLSFSQDWQLGEVANWTGFNQDNKANEITGITNTTGGAWSTPSYDAVGNTTKTPNPNDPTDSSQDLQLTYDAWNRVVKVTDSETPFVDRLGLYEYDARGFRIIKHTYDSSDTAQKSIHNYYTSSWQCIEEREVDLTITQPAPQVLSKQYVWGLRYVDDLIQRQRDTTGNGTLDETLYAMQDRQFNVVALSDTSGTVQQRMSYTGGGYTVVYDRLQQRAYFFSSTH